MTKPRIHRICVIGDRYGKGGRDRLSGILRYAACAKDWSLSIHIRGTPSEPKSLRTILADQQPEGIIVLSCDEKIAELIRDYQVSGRNPSLTMTVDLGNSLKECIHTDLDVRLDNQAIAQASMKLLMRRGYSNFAYVGYSHEPQISAERCDAVRQISEADGCPFFSTDDADDIIRLASWLKSLPTPCGIITYYDIRSRDVLDACRIAHLAVPQQMAIIGSDDDPSICEASRPTLSSILPDFENGMYLAAAKFHKLLRKRKRPVNPHQMRYGVKSITERGSTVDLNCGGLLISAAREFIRENASRSISVRDVAAHCRVSRRLLEMRFRQIISHTVREEIERVRLSLVCTFLKETGLPLQDVTRRAGFASQSYLCTLFRKKFGCRMHEYRNDRTETGVSRIPKTGWLV